MATGIIPTATFLLGMKWLAWVLLVINLIVYEGRSSFTVIAGTCVLGSQLLFVAGRYQVAMVLWVLGLILWALVMHTFLTAVTVRENKHHTHLLSFHFRQPHHCNAHSTLLD